MRGKTHSFEIEQNGVIVASGDAPDAATAEREGFHYAVMFAQDGPVKLRLGTEMAIKPLKQTSPQQNETGVK